MNFIKRFLDFFTTITTCILMIVAISFVFSDYSCDAGVLLRNIIISGIVTALITAVIYGVEFRSKKQFVLLTLLHYLLLSIVMIILGINFGWIMATLKGAVQMMLDVAAVYAMVFAISYFIEKKETDKLNEALEKKYRDK